MSEMSTSEKLDAALRQIQEALTTVSDEANARAFRPGVNQARLQDAEGFLRSAATIIQGERNKASYEERRR